MNTFSMALIDSSEEFFLVGSQKAKLSYGQVTYIDGLPDYFKILLEERLNSDRAAQRGLDLMGITKHDDRINTFFQCNFSSYDGSADITTSGQLGKYEFTNCTKRELCPAEGKCCKFPANLSPVQAKVAKRIGKGFMDAEICHELEFTQNTLRNHKNAIELKIGTTGKIAIAVFALKNGLI